MEQQRYAEAQPEHYDLDLHRARQNWNRAWRPNDATPGRGSPSPSPSPSPPTLQGSHVSFAPVSSPSGAGADNASNEYLDIGSADHDGQFPGYYPVVSRDSFQQDSSRPPSPLPGPGDPLSAQSAESKLWKMLSGGWPMYAMFCLGIAFVVGHDAFYTYVDGRPADDQIRMMRYGGLFSYAAKASLVAAVIFAYRQQVWVIVNGNVLQLKTIDSLFAAVDEPQTMLNWEFLKKGKMAVCLAVLAWLFPLTVILTPATLTVALLTETIEDRCYNIRTLNFEREKKKDWRRPEEINGLSGFSLSRSNCTIQDSLNLVGAPFNATFFDYWTGTNQYLDILAGQVARTGPIIPRHNAGLEICGGGWNCTYTVSFKAPGYKCSELARGRKLDEDALRRQGLLFNASDVMPSGSYSYLARTNMGEYALPQLNSTWTGGAPKIDPPFPEHLGAFRTEPVLEIGYTVTTEPGDLPKNRSDPRWDTAFEAAVFRCEHYVTNYTVQFNHTSTQQIATVLEREYLHPVINTTFIPTKDVGDGTEDNTVASPEFNYVLPVPDFETYRLTAAYHSIGKRMRSYLEGTVHLEPWIQSLYENITLSLLSSPRFVVVSWAADPTRSSGKSNSTDPALSYPCVKTRMANGYVYDRRGLWIAYGVAIGAACFAVVLGSAALGQNGFHVRDMRVSSVIAATRAPGLENLPWMMANNGGKVSDEMLRMKLGYGAITEPTLGGTPATAKSMGPGGVGGSLGVVHGGKVYYGFAPREVLERSRARRVWAREADEWGERL